MHGLAFEVSIDKKTGHFTGRSLDEIEGFGFVSVVVTNGKVKKMFENACQIAFLRNDEYQHVTLLVDAASGEVSLKPLPYRSHPYPNKDLVLHNVFEESSGKVWAIYEDMKQDLHTFFANPQTGGRLVYLQVSKTISMADRIAEKLAKGYVKTSLKSYGFNSRKLY